MMNKWMSRFFALGLLIAVTPYFINGCRQKDDPKIPREQWQTVVTGKALSAQGGPVAGVIALEGGDLYSKNYLYGGEVDKDGRFSVKLPAGGDYGMHIYASQQIYHPEGVHIKADQENRFEVNLPPNPAEAEAPRISNVQFLEKGRNSEQVTIKLEVNDPNANLSHQVIGVNIATQESLLFSPVTFVWPWQMDYPNGTYILAYQTRGRPFDPEEWRFLAADNRCYTSRVLKAPFDEPGVVAARPEGYKGEQQKGETELTQIESGRGVFEKNCAFCHFADKRETKIGPGLQGLFERELSPVEEVPVTEEYLRSRIENGGEKMPSYSHIKETQLSALIAYLKTL